MTKDEMKYRTKQFALRVIKLVENLPDTMAAKILGGQLLRSGTSVGANYRAACRAKSTADFLHKMSIVEEEADESVYWMELLTDSQIVQLTRLQNLMNEGNQIVAITVASIKTVKARRQKHSIQKG